MEDDFDFAGFTPSPVTSLPSPSFSTQRPDHPKSARKIAMQPPQRISPPLPATVQHQHPNPNTPPPFSYAPTPGVPPTSASSPTPPSPSPSPLPTDQDPDEQGLQYVKYVVSKSIRRGWGWGREICVVEPPCTGIGIARMNQTVVWRRRTKGNHDCISGLVHHRSRRR